MADPSEAQHQHRAAAIRVAECAQYRRAEERTQRVGRAQKADHGGLLRGVWHVLRHDEGQHREHQGKAHREEEGRDHQEEWMPR